MGLRDVIGLERNNRGNVSGLGAISSRSGSSFAISFALSASVADIEHASGGGLSSEKAEKDDGRI